MKLFQIILLLLTLTISCTKTTKEEVKINNKNAMPFSIGESIELKSDILNEHRLLNIYLPNGYTKDSKKKYPVIYLLDGSKDEDFIHISGIVQFGSFSWINMIPESIVVGISNIDRKQDFTYPTKNKKDLEDFPTTGGSEKFIQFIAKELQPFIDNRYQTSATKTIIGQSLGGLLATEVLFKTPDLFDNYIIISPSLWWDDESLLRYAPKSYSANKSVYVAVGKEGTIMERTAKELHTKLSAINNENTSLFFNFLENKNHGDALHLATYDAFEKIFKRKEK